MTDQPANNASVSRPGLTIGGITALLAMIASYSGALDYLKNSGLLDHWPQLRAVVLGVTIGIAFSAWIPYVVGKDFCAGRMQSIMRAGSSVITFAAAWRLQPSELGMYYALVAALAGRSLYMSASRIIYRAFPALEPPALRSGAPDA